MTQRIVWAEVTNQKLRDIRDQIKELERQRRDVQAQCNHVYSTGKSALENWTDNDPYGPVGPTSGTRCTVCDTAFENID